MREVVYDNWCKCSNKLCGRYFNRKLPKGLSDGNTCTVCNIGKLNPYTLTDEQIFFMVNEKAQATDEEELKSIKQELSLTAEEAFISKGEQVFSSKSIEFVEYCVSKAQTPMKGFLDRYGYFHGFHPDDIDRKCHDPNCSIRHITDEHNLWIWDKPVTNARYQIGADVVKQIRKITFCGNDGDPIYCKDFVEICAWLKETNPRLQLVVVTNGSYKNENWWQQLAGVLNQHDEVNWSLDGWDQHSNEQYRVVS